MHTFFDDCISAMADLLAKVVSADVRTARGREVFHHIHPHVVGGWSHVIGRSSESIMTALLVLMHSVIEEGEANWDSLLMLWLLQQLLIAEGLSIFFELSGEGVLMSARMISSEIS